MKYLIILILLTQSVYAENRLIVPLYTQHIGDQGYVDLDTNERVPYNNDNRGLGFEYSGNGYATGITYFDKNSYSEKSTYIHLVKTYQLKDFTFGMGGALASGYERVSETSWIGAPLFSVEYSSFRIVTSYPFGNIAKPTGTDFINIQYIIEF